MRLYVPGLTTTTPPDRNAVQKNGTVQLNGVAPHALTVRATYTVPAGKRFLLTAVHLWVRRRTAATTAGLVQMKVDTSLGIEIPIQSSKNAIDDLMSSDAAPNVLLQAGETVNTRTSDTSTGGTVDYLGGYMGYEFD